MTDVRFDALLHRVTRVLVFAVVAAFAITGLSLLTDGADGSPGRHHRRAAHADLATLVAATTDTTLRGAPLDRQPQAGTEGEVVRPLRTIAVFARPGKRPFAKVTPRQIGPAWLPVVDRRGGWSQVLLPSRPNGAVGWLRTDAVQRRTTPYLIRVHLGSRRLELQYDGEPAGDWPVAIGAPATPTPTGRTFLLGSITDSAQRYSPVILPLGTHSQTLDSYGGGPGTVALHTWPDDSVFGQAVSHGCIRVPADALERLTQVPLGTLVVVDER